MRAASVARINSEASIGQHPNGGELAASLDNSHALNGALAHQDLAAAAKLHGVELGNGYVFRSKRRNRRCKREGKEGKDRADHGRSLSSWMRYICSATNAACPALLPHRQNGGS